MPGAVVILGLGFTTQRLARLLLERRVPVHAAVRDAGRYSELRNLGAKIRALSAAELPKNATIVHSIPPLPEPEKSALRKLIREITPRRIVYISSTGIYGAATEVDEETPEVPNDEKGRARADEEQWIEARENPWSSLILRSAAIYGPGRGIHVRLREGRLKDGEMPRGAHSIVSRIHVDDLVALLDAAIDSTLYGAWPVADECPASSEEVAIWCAREMKLKAPEFPPAGIQGSGRRVNGGKIRELLGVALKYPTYRAGIAASLREEERELSRPNRPPVSSR
jgi:nucleoside-diphosphate-sugar epimerase